MAEICRCVDTFIAAAKVLIGSHRSNALHDGSEEKSNVAWQCLAVNTGAQQPKETAWQVAFPRQSKAVELLLVFGSQ
jgi:hypothetical protein